MDFLLDFITHYMEGIYHLWPILLALLAVIGALGLRVGHLERWHPSDAVYYALVCATSLGTSALMPTRHRTKWLTVAISLIGVLFVGLIVSIGLEAVSHAFRQATGAAPPIAP